MILIRQVVRRSLPIVVAVLCTVLLLAGAHDRASAVEVADELPFHFIPLVFTEAPPAPLCRFAVNATSDVADYPLQPLRLGWYMNFSSSSNPSRPNGIEYKPVIRLCATGIPPQNQRFPCYPNSIDDEDIVQRVLAMPGADWFIGNEPDRPDHALAGQDAVDPVVYAQRYHDLYTLIKATDPTARLLAGSIVQPSEVRLQYLDLVLDAYRQAYSERMPVDGWSIHNYLLNEKSCRHFPPEECWGADIPPGVPDTSGLVIEVKDHDDFGLFTAQIERFRAWMAERGYRHTPLYLSEFGVLMPQGVFNPDFDAARVNAFMTKAFDYLRTTTNAATGYPADGNRLVQSSSWYSTSDSTFNGRLFDPDTRQLTAVGSHFASYVAPIVEESDYFPLRLFAAPVQYTGTPVTVTLSAVIANSGNAANKHPVVVRFYHGDPAAGGVQIGENQIVSLAGCGDTKTVQIAWADRPAGVYEIYVQVAPANSRAPEADGSNNTAHNTILVANEQLFTPLISRD